MTDDWPRQWESVGYLADGHTYLKQPDGTYKRLRRRRRSIPLGDGVTLETAGWVRRTWGRLTRRGWNP